MPNKIWDSLLLTAGAIGVLSPDLTRLGPWLASLDLGWAIHVIHILGGLALLTSTWKIFRDRLLASRLWNFLLLGAGIVSIISPDLTGLTTWLASLRVGWLTHIAHGIGGLMLVAARWDRVAGRLDGEKK